MEYILPEIVSVGIFNAQSVFHDKIITNKRTTTMFEIEIPIEKGGVSYINSESVKIEPSTVICAKPGQIRRTKLPFKCYYIHFILKEGALYEHLMSTPDFVLTDRSDKYFKVFERMQKVFESPSNEDEILLYSLVTELIYMLAKDSKRLRTRELIKPNNFVIIERTLKYIKENLSADLSLKIVAAYAGMSPIYFHNCFKAATARTLREYIEEQRIKKAANMLITTDFTLAKIAYECGFSSQAYFSYAFKRKMNQTPREYAKSIFERYDKDI